MKTSQSALIPPALLAFAASAALLNPDPERLLAQGLLAMVFFFTFAIFIAEQILRPALSRRRLRVVRYDA